MPVKPQNSVPLKLHLCVCTDTEKQITDPPSSHPLGRVLSPPKSQDECLGQSCTSAVTGLGSKCPRSGWMGLGATRSGGSFPACARGLERGYPSGPFQPKPFCASMTFFSLCKGSDNMQITVSLKEWFTEDVEMLQSCLW